MEPITLETFQEWSHHPVTKRLFKRLKADREALKEGLVYDSFDNSEEVKGRCRVLQILLDLEYEELMSND